MKKILQICCWWTMASCNRFASAKNGPETLPGVYVNESLSSYSKAIDTLTLSKEGDAENVFLVTRHVVFQRIRKGRAAAKEYELEKWIAIYHEEGHQLTEAKKGRVLTWVASEEKLYLGNTSYKKLK